MKNKKLLVLASLFTATVPLLAGLLIWSILDSLDSPVFGELIIAGTIIFLVPPIIGSTVGAVQFSRQYFKLENNGLVTYLVGSVLAAAAIIGIVYSVFFIFTINDSERDTPLAEKLESTRIEINARVKQDGRLPNRDKLPIKNDEDVLYEIEDSESWIYRICANFHTNTLEHYGDLPAGFVEESVIEDELDQEDLFYIHAKGKQCYRLKALAN